MYFSHYFIECSCTFRKDNIIIIIIIIIFIIIIDDDVVVVGPPSSGRRLVIHKYIQSVIKVSNIFRGGSTHQNKKKI